MIYFSSDSHYGEPKHLKGYSEGGYRDFPTIEDHDDYLLSKYNVATKKDLIVFCGDFGRNIEKYKNKIRCRNWIFIRGNHDPSLKKLKYLFHNVYDLRQQRLNGHMFILCHYPIISWQKMRHSAFHVYGHSHGSLKFDLGKAMDVGVDTNNYNMYTIDEVIERLSKKSINVVDGHVPDK